MNSDNLCLAVESVWDNVLQGRSADTTAAVDALWRSLEFSGAELDWLARLGLSELAKREQRSRRSKGLPAIAVEKAPGVVWEQYLSSLTSVYDDADGIPRSLLDFSVADWAALQERMASNASSYRRRARLARRAEHLLLARGLSYTRELDEHDLRLLAAEADLVFRTHQG
jgi:hypothetical protein